MFIVYECSICRRFTGAYQRDGLCEACAQRLKVADGLATKDAWYGARLALFGGLAVLIMYVAIIFFIYKLVVWL